MANNNTDIPKVYNIEGKYMMQLESTPKSGLYKFIDVVEREIYLYEKSELPEYILNQLEFSL